jgi:uncharacterized protein YdeI (YjbR/CyaY-like superfamily)
MATRNKRVDAYIANAADFAKRILTHLRGLVHAACPDVEEDIKWGHIAFLHHGMLASMAGFKAHCGFGFWKGILIFGTKDKEDNAMGRFGRITCLADLPGDDKITGWLKEAVVLNETGVKKPAPAKPARRAPLAVPDFFDAALRKNKKAAAVFEAFSYSHKKEYIDWLAEAKREETRQKRLATALQWLTEGKPRHWKYANC